MPIFFPISCCGVLISGRAMICNGMRFSSAAARTTVAPRNAAWLLELKSVLPADASFLVDPDRQLVSGKAGVPGMYLGDFRSTRVSCRESRHDRHQHCRFKQRSNNLENHF